MKPILIAGAGLSGLTAAVNLARAGRNVVVHEQGPTVGVKYGGDFQGFENWSTEMDALGLVRSWGWETTFPHVPFHTVTYYDADLRPYPVTWEKPIFYLTKRGPFPHALDTHLLQQVQDAGVEVRLKSRVDPEEADIVATGPRGGSVAVVGATFPIDLEDQAHAILDDRLAPGGYTYFLVMRGEVTLAAYFAGPIPRTAFRDAVARFSSLLNVRVPEDAHRFGGVLGFRLAMPAGDQIHVGEAAGFQDYLWGFGMRFAMQSGFLAAKALLEGRSYRDMVAEEILPKLKAGLVNRFAYGKMGNRGYALALRQFAASPDLPRKLRETYATLTAKHHLFYPLAKRILERGRAHSLP